MCGIIGIVKNNPDPKIVGQLCHSLTNLQYRGYDSAGIAFVQNGNIKTIKKVGEDAISSLAKTKAKPHCGIGHTRWATHGKVSVTNAHPHTVDGVSVVHNGIIEDFLQTKKWLINKGAKFRSETDSELIAQLIAFNLKKGLSPKAAFTATIAKLKGSYAVVAIFKGHNDMMLAACLRSPLAIGRGKNGSLVASDIIGLGGLATEAFYLKDNQIAELTSTATIVTANGEKIALKYEPIDAKQLPSKGKYRHFMLKEIFEQPKAISDTFREKLELPPKPKSVCIVACGTSHFASMLGRYWLEQYARLDVYVEMASEFRYRYPIFSKDRLYIFVSQSGETADTLAALRFAKEHKVRCLAIVNEKHSSLAREADYNIITKAGREIGVASTKGFSTQIMALARVALHYATKDKQTDIHLKKLSTLGAKIARFYNQKNVTKLKKMGEKLAKHSHILFLGRGKCYPLAMEAALKTKEISYIHSQAYPAGEMKHGPIALIEATLPTVILAPHNELFTKTMANMEEVLSIFKMPKTGLFTMPLVYAPAVQLLSYYTALARNCEIDRPRNLAKSVTVE